MVDLALAIRTALVPPGPIADRRRDTDPGRPSGASGFLRPFCHPRSRHSSSGFSDASSGCIRMVSLCPESDVRRRSLYHRWSSPAVQQRPGTGIWGCGLASGPPIRPGVPRTENALNISRRVPTLPRQRPQVDPAPNPVAPIAHALLRAASPLLATPGSKDSASTLGLQQSSNLERPCRLFAL